MQTSEIIFCDLNKNQVELMWRRMILSVTILGCAGVAWHMLIIVDEQQILVGCVDVM